MFNACKNKYVWWGEWFQEIIQQKLHLIKYNLNSAVLFILTLGVPEVTPVFEKIRVNCHLHFFNDLKDIKAVTNFSPYTPQHIF